MKVRSNFRLRALLATVAQGRSLLRGCGRQARRSPWFALGCAAAAVIGALLLFPQDHLLLAALHFWTVDQERVAHRIAYWLGTWGDYPTYNLPAAVLIWIYACWKESRWWRRVALAAFFGATLAGVCDDCLRLTLGRPRPDTHLPDHFYGFWNALHGGYQSFPSGHAASVVGMGIALLYACRPLGIITTLYAFAVMWARLELYRHYPSDVFVGAAIGLYFGVLVGRAVREQRKHMFT